MVLAIVLTVWATLKMFDDDDDDDDGSSTSKIIKNVTGDLNK